jgi:putative SOS response-associated peptidase YedK
MRKLFAKFDVAAQVVPQPGIFPDYAAPIIRNEGGPLPTLAMTRWGMPSPKFALEGKKTDPGITNVRNTGSPHWRRWLGVESRCLVPFSSFSEFNREAGGDIWFAFGEDRPLAFFAGIWTPQWTSVRKLKEGEVSADLYAFLTTTPNAEVGAIHPKAMPVILTTPEECEIWMTAPWSEAGKLQRPLPDGSLAIVGRGLKKDGAALDAG